MLMLTGKYCKDMRELTFPPITDAAHVSVMA
jgi:hypothetical protein